MFKEFSEYKYSLNDGRNVENVENILGKSLPPFPSKFSNVFSLRVIKTQDCVAKDSVTYIPYSSNRKIILSKPYS